MKTLVAPVVLVAVTSTFIALSSPAHACPGSQPSCDPSRIVLTPRGALLPANVPAIAGRAWSPTQLLKFEVAAVDTEAPATTSAFSNGWTFLKLDTPLVEGASYRVVAQGHCDPPFSGDHLGEVVFRAGPPKALPTTIGSVNVAYASARVLSPNPLVDGGYSPAGVGTSLPIGVVPCRPEGRDVLLSPFSRCSARRCSRPEAAFVGTEMTAFSCRRRRSENGRFFRSSCRGRAYRLSELKQAHRGFVVEPSFRSRHAGTSVRMGLA